MVSSLKNLTLESSFHKYVKHSFAPVGLMIDTWEKEYTGGGGPVAFGNHATAPISMR